METHEGQDPCHDLMLSMRRQLREANLKLDHIIFRMRDDYDHQFHQDYGRHLRD